MVPFSGCIADANTVLNTITADVLKMFADELEGVKDFEVSLKQLIRREMKAHHRILFNGNGYTEDWVQEAKRRGLPNIVGMVDAIPELAKKESVDLFERHGVCTEKVLLARADVSYELYSRTINIEALTMIDMAGKDIIPSVIRFTTEVAQSVHAVESIGGDPEVQRELLDNVTALLKEAKAALADLRVKQSKAVELTGKEQARFYYKTVCPAMQNLRNPIDRLEMMVSGDLWPMPAYDELLFNV